LSNAVLVGAVSGRSVQKGHEFTGNVFWIGSLASRKVTFRWPSWRQARVAFPKGLPGHATGNRYASAKHKPLE